MKKFLATLLLCLLAVISIFAFTACENTTDNNDGKDNTEQTGGSDETDNTEQQKPQIKYTVTKEEWAEALGLFDIEKVAENSSRLNLTASATNISNGSASNGYSVDINYSDKTAYLGAVSYEEGVKSTVQEHYFWQKDDGSISHCCIENSNKEYYNHYEDNDFNACVIDVLKYVAGYIFEWSDYDKYEYNEENFEYSSYYAEMDMTFVFKFENSKLVNFSMRAEGIEYKYEYSYGSSLTIPETILKN